MSNLGEWCFSVPEAKSIASENNSYLIVVSCNTDTCHYCQEAEEKVFKSAVWKNYAREHRMPQYLANGFPKTSREVRSALHKEYNNPFYPAVMIFKVLDTADLTTDGLNQKFIKATKASWLRRKTEQPAQNPNVKLIGKFLFRRSKKLVNNIRIDDITPEMFIKLIESFV